jgi:hypothetical protein
VEIPRDIIPPEVNDLGAELRRRGYFVADERYDDDAFGNALILFERDGTLVRVMRDRGQWFAEVSAAGWNDWFAPIIWRALLGSSMPSLEPTAFADQAQALLDDLDRIEATNRSSDDEQLARLRAWRSRRAEARRALPPRPAT